MANLKDLFCENDAIQVIVEQEDYLPFLEYAKRENCLWKCGDIINLNKEKVQKGKVILIVTKDLLIYRPQGLMGYMLAQGLTRFKFKMTKRDNIVENFLERFILEKKDTNDENIRHLKQEIFFNKCEENRKINKLQLENMDVIKKFPPKFFVKVKNDDEKTKLLALLKGYGYVAEYTTKNNHNLKSQKLYLIDNRYMTFDNAKLKL